MPNSSDVQPELRAALQNAIDKQPESVAAGSDFPDFLYACGKYAVSLLCLLVGIVGIYFEHHHNTHLQDHHDAAEAAHWPRFHVPAVNYARNLPDFNSDGHVWSEDTQKLVAFIYGLIVHYVTDEIWEGLAADLGDGHGFVELVNGLNRAGSGSGDQDETTTNMAGDYYAAWILNETGLHPWKRQFPLKHVFEIYHRTPEFSGHSNFTNVTLASLEECEVLFDLGLWALITFGSVLEPRYNNQIKEVPIVSERLIDMPFSGLDGMATATAFAWARLTRWFQHGPPLAPPPRETEADAAADDDDRSTAAFFRALRPYAQVTDTLKRMPPAQLREMFTALPPSTGETARRFMYHGPAELKDDLTGVLRAVSLRHCGQSVQVEVVDAASKPPPAAALEEPRAASLSPFSEGRAPVQYHGGAVVTGDFDHDGHADVAIGAYGAGVQADTPQAGEVLVTYNASNGGQRRSRLQAAQQQPEAQFGRAMAVLDFNLDGVDDLAVSAPGASDWDLSSPSANPFPTNQTPSSFRSWGKVYVLLGQAGVGLETTRAIILETKRDWLTLGAVSHAADIDGDGHDDLLLGCPFASAENGAAHGGRVFGVLSSTANVASSEPHDVEQAAALSLSGRDRFEMFGQSMALVADDMLVVGAPFSRVTNTTTGQRTIATGRVYGFNLSVANAVTVSAQLVFEITTSPGAALGEFGFAVASSRSAVAIAGPSVGSPETTARHGSVWLLDAGIVAGLRGNITASSMGGRQFNGTREYSRFGHTLAFADLDRDGREDLVVAAPMYTRMWVDFAARELGAVHVLESHSDSSTLARVVGTRPRGRFGAAFASVPGLGLLVASPRAPSASGEMVGAVDVVTQWKAKKVTI